MPLSLLRGFLSFIKNKMPIYEFYCKKCDEIIQVVQSYSEYDSNKKVKHCGDICQRIFNSPSVHMEAATNEDMIKRYKLNERPEEQDPWGWKYAGKVPKSAKWDWKEKKYKQSKKNFQIKEKVNLK